MLSPSNRAAYKMRTVPPHFAKATIWQGYPYGRATEANKRTTRDGEADQDLVLRPGDGGLGAFRQGAAGGGQETSSERA